MTAIDASLPGRASRSGWNGTLASAGERTRAFRKARRHSWLVGTLRLLLPLLAVGSFAWYFAEMRLSLKIGEGVVNVPVPKFDGENFRMENPRYEGFSKGGGRFVVTAVFGIQDIRNPTVFKLNTIEGRLTELNGDWASVVSDRGVYDSKKELLELAGRIKVVSSSGLTAHLKSAQVAVKEHTITSAEPVLVELQNGSTVDSDSMRLDSASKEVSFQGNVRSHLARPPEPERAAGAADGTKVPSESPAR